MRSATVSKCVAYCLVAAVSACATIENLPTLTYTEEIHNARNAPISAIELAADPEKYRREFVHFECYVVAAPMTDAVILVHAICGREKNDGMDASLALRSAYGDAEIVLTGAKTRELMFAEMTAITGRVLPDALAAHAAGSGRLLPTVRVDYLR